VYNPGQSQIVFALSHHRIYYLCVCVCHHLLARMDLLILVLYYLEAFNFKTAVLLWVAMRFEQCDACRYSHLYAVATSTDKTAWLRFDV